LLLTNFALSVPHDATFPGIQFDLQRSSEQGEAVDLSVRVQGALRVPGKEALPSGYIRLRATFRPSDRVTRAAVESATEPPEEALTCIGEQLEATSARQAVVLASDRTVVGIVEDLEPMRTLRSRALAGRANEIALERSRSGHEQRRRRELSDGCGHDGVELEVGRGV